MLCEIKSGFKRKMTKKYWEPLRENPFVARCVLVRFVALEMCLSTFGRKWGLGLVTWQDVVRRSPRCLHVKVYAPRGRYLGGAWCGSLPSCLIPYPSSIGIGLGIHGNSTTIYACPSSCFVRARLSCWSHLLRLSCRFGLGFLVGASPCQSGFGGAVSFLVL